MLSLLVIVCTSLLWNLKKNLGKICVSCTWHSSVSCQLLPALSFIIIILLHFGFFERYRVAESIYKMSRNRGKSNLLRRWLFHVGLRLKHFESNCVYPPRARLISTLPPDPMPFLPLGTGQRQWQIMEDKFVISEQLLLLIPRVCSSPEADRKGIGTSYYFGVKLLTWPDLGPCVCTDVGLCTWT